jgi:hypothetical protein
MPLLLFGADIFAPNETRASLRFFLGFEPWRLVAVTELADGRLLTEESFSPQHGTWSRISILDESRQKTADVIFTTETRVHVATPTTAWVSRNNQLLSLSLADMTVGQTLEDAAARHLGREVASASLDTRGKFTSITRDDGRTHRWALPDARVAWPATEALTRRTLSVGGVSWSVEGDDLRATVRGPAVSEELIDPVFLALPDTASATQGVWVVHRQTADSSRRLLSRFTETGREWTLTLLGESTEGNVEVLWTERRGPGLLLLVGVDASQQTRTEVVAVDDEGRVTPVTTL